MSSLIFYLDAEQALVATDTLAVLDNGQPYLFTTKAFLVPHLRLLVCGTGAGGFVGKWFIQVNDGMLVRDIDHLDQHTPNNLAALWQRHKNELAFPAAATVTVYHFGFSEAARVLHGYAYRSTNDFRSEPFSQYGIGIKPECQVPDNYELPKDIKKMMEEQRTRQAMLPPEQRVYIGGAIQIHHLTMAGCSIYTLDRLSGYEADERAMYANYEQHRQNPA